MLYKAHDPDIQIKINEFVADNITNPRIIKRLLRKHVQQQTNSSDCGVFAVAFLSTFSLVLTLLATVKFDVGKMRSYLYSCLQSGKFEHLFLKVEGKHEHGLPNNMVIEVLVYCVCQMPYFEDDNEVREFQMADCDCCHQWYHRSCVGVPDYVFKQNKFWFCS